MEAGLSKHCRSLSWAQSLCVRSARPHCGILSPLCQARSQTLKIRKSTKETESRPHSSGFF